MILMVIVQINGKDGIGEEQFCRLLVKIEKQWNPTLENQPGSLTEYGKKIYEKSIVLGAVVDGEIVGIAAVYVNNHDTKQAYLTYIACFEKFTHCGYGSELLNSVLKTAQEAGMHQIMLEVKKTNRRAYNFYKKHGFVYSEDASDNSAYLLRKL